MLLARRVRLRPSRAQREALARASGTERYAWNWGLRQKVEALALRKTAIASGMPKSEAPEVPGYCDLRKELVRLKNLPEDQGGVPWMYEVSKCVPEEALRDLEKAFGDFFRRLKAGEPPGFPKFKSRRHNFGHFTLRGMVHVNPTHIQLPRIGLVRISPGTRNYAPAGAYKSVSLVQEHGEWYASVRIEIPEAAPVALDALPEVGIDLGARKLAVLAAVDGTIEIIPNRKALLRHARRLRAAQKVAARRVKGSGRRRRAIARVGRIHQRIANVRADMTHQATARIAATYRVVAVEDLQVANMTRARKGKGKSAKSGLNRVVLDANPGEFRRQLDYKLRLRGGRLVAVDPAYTSRRCSCCGAFSEATSSETFTCSACAAVFDRDVNAARNILSLARGEIDTARWSASQNARGEPVSRRSLRAAALGSMKRERDREGVA